MGGYSNWTPPPPPHPAKVKAEEFFATRDPTQRQNTLLALYQAAEKDGIDFVSYLTNESSAKNGISGIEIEMKLTVPEFSEDTLAEKLRRFALPQKQDRFLKSSAAQKSQGTNHYFGTPTEERFIIIENTHGKHLKTKGRAEPYALGVPGEEFVLRRTESIKQIVKSAEEDLLEFTKTIALGCAPSPVTYLGAMEKNKVTCYTLERTTGSIYSVTLGVCTAAKREPLRQLEIEYAGTIPNFPNQKGVESEHKILEDILEMAGMFEQHGLKPTTLTKFEWLVGKPEQVPEKKEEKPAAKPKGVQAGQSMFGESLD